MSLRARLLRVVDPLFPVNPAAKLSAPEHTAHETTKASSTMGRYIAELARKDVDVVDFGCGYGGETMWLSQQVRSAIGVDADPECVDQATRALAARTELKCRFVQSTDGVIPLPDASVDAVFSNDTFEHVMDLDRGFREIHRILRPGGVVISRFGPLFYSPQGYHLFWACQVPYAHLLFGLEAILALRHERSGEISRSKTWRDTGVNCKRFSDFKRAAQGAGFVIERFEPVAVRNLTWLTRIPLVRDLFIFGIDLRLRRSVPE